MNKLQIFSLVAATSLALPSCMTSYDRNGQPVHSVDPGLAVVGSVGTGLIGENQTPPKEPYSTNSQAFNSPAISNTYPKLRLFGPFGGGGLIPLSKTKETNVLFGALGKCATRKDLSAGRFLDKSAFLLSHGARTTPSSSLDGSKNHSSISLF